jgi:hypothetical protein
MLKSSQVPTQRKKLMYLIKNDKFIVSIGAIGYMDYPTYLETSNKALADTKRKAYKARHEKDRHVKGTAGYYADQILW